MRNISKEIPIYYLWILLTRTRRAISNNRTDKELSPLGVSSPEAAILFALSNMNKDEKICADLARWTFRKPHAVSQLINRMCAKGLVVRKPDKKNKKLIMIEMTDLGMEIEKKARVISSIEDSFSILSDEEKRQLLKILTKLFSHMMKILKVDNKARSMFYLHDNIHEKITIKS